MAARRSAKPLVRRYVHTGGFNQLAGKSLAPGSMRAELFYWKWRLFFGITALLIVGTGLISLCWY